MSFSRSLLVLAAVGVGCAGPPAAVHPAKVAQAAPVVQVSPGVPAEALGVYDGGASTLLIALEQLDERLFIIVPGRRAVVLRAEKNPTGFTLSAPPELMNAPEDEPQLPHSYRLEAPTPGYPHWRLDSQLGSLDRREDRFAVELAANLRERELVGVSDKGLETRAQLAHYLRLLRDETAKEWHDIANSHDPASLQDQGGVRGYLCSALGSTLDELRPAASGPEVVRLQEYVVAAHKAQQGGPLWPRSDDAFLVALAQRLLLTKETLSFPEGKLLSIGTLDQQGVAGCDLAVLLPDPTVNGSRRWAPFERPPPGKLGAFSYVGLVLQSGASGSCRALAPGRGMYPVRHGVYFFYLLADSRAQAKGAEFVAYMTASLFVARDIANSDLTQLLQQVNEEISRQAE